MILPGGTDSIRQGARSEKASWKKIISDLSLRRAILFAGIKAVQPHRSAYISVQVGESVESNVLLAPIGLLTRVLDFHRNLHVLLPLHE